MSKDEPSSRSQPFRGFEQAIASYQQICAARGYCGPFINEDIYNNFPDPMWRGCGECVICGSTCVVRHEEDKRRRSETRAPSVLQVPEH